MFPVICKIGPVTLYSYGLMLAIAVIVCSFMASRDARAVGIKSELVLDFIFWLVFAGILGARLFYIAINFNYFRENPLEIIMIQHGGLAWQGGFVCATLSSFWFTRKHRLSWLQMADLMAPYIALGQAIGRIGCFLNGCCYGKKIINNVFPLFKNSSLHPTQLYLFIGLFTIFIILKRYQKAAKIPGEVFVLFMILEPMLRFFIEFVRADHDVIYRGLSIYQIVCLIFISVAIYVYTRLKSRAAKHKSAS